MLEMLGSPDKRAFNPARDVARLIMPLMSKTIENIKTVDGPAGLVRDGLGVSEQELVDVAVAMKNILEPALDVAKTPQTLGGAFEKSGFDKTRYAAQAVFFTRLGQLYFATAYRGIRDIMDVDGTVCTDEMLLTEALEQMQKPSWLCKIRKAIGL